MAKTRRMGSITLGITLLVIGILYLIHLFAPAVNFILILKFWPVVFIILGAEILFENIKSRYEENVKYVYDIASILMIMATGVFTMGMACMEYMIMNGFINY